MVRLHWTWPHALLAQSIRQESNLLSTLLAYTWITWTSSPARTYTLQQDADASECSAKSHSQNEAPILCAIRPSTVVQSAILEQLNSDKTSHNPSQTSAPVQKAEDERSIYSFIVQLGFPAELLDDPTPYRRISASEESIHQGEQSQQANACL